MVWASTTTCKRNLPRKRVRPPLLRNMRFTRRWLPSIAKYANFEGIRHWRAKKNMWSIHKWDPKNFPDCNYRRVSPIQAPIGILYSLKLPWDEALQKEGAAFVYRSVRFLTEEGILRWVAANGNHIPLNAAPSGDCRKCTSLRVEEGKRR